MTNKIANDELRKRIDSHMRWLAGDKASGNQLVLMDVLVSGITLTEDNLSCAEFIRCRIEESRFVKCDLSYSLLIDSVADGCSFLHCSLVKSDLRNARLSRADFSGSDLTRADLSRANLAYANLKRAILSWAWLVETDLRFANIEEARVEGTRFVKTKIFNTRQFHFGTLDRAVVTSVDSSPEGDGTEIGGVELLEALRDSSAQGRHH
jgi:uncharacterized protein YjbI with pentapeptide repeats